MCLTTVFTIQNKLSFINVRQSCRLTGQYIVTASRVELCSCDFHSKYFVRGIPEPIKNSFESKVTKQTRELESVLSRKLDRSRIEFEVWESIQPY